MLQCQLCQPISNPPKNMDKLHKVDMRGRIDVDWAEKHSKWIRLWREKTSMVVVGQPKHDHFVHSVTDMEWYRTNLITFIGIEQSRGPTHTEFGETSSQPHQTEHDDAYTNMHDQTTYIPSPLHTPITHDDNQTHFSPQFPQSDFLMPNDFTTSFQTPASAKGYHQFST